MPDFILIEGNKTSFMPNFGAAVVVVEPAEQMDGGPIALDENQICMAGEEQDISVPGCAYLTPQYSIPGTGTLKISSTAVLPKGRMFMAEFEVQSPARQPQGHGSPISDSKLMYAGVGMFVPSTVA